jgi:co-chaperonin GroES (HSP10)
MSSTIAPVGNKILVLPLKKVEEQINGIIHTQVEDADLHRGEVVAVSKELVTPEGEPLYSVGDKILFASRGALGQMYRGAHHVWLEHRLEGGTIYGVVTEEN